MKRKANAFSLFEILIAFSLISILLSVLFTALKNICALGPKIEKAQFEAISRSYVQQRLSQLFSQIDPHFQGEKVFYTQISKQGKAELFFILHHDIDPDPAFCAHVKGHLYLDRNRQLILNLTPLEGENPPIREEVIMKDIESATFSFYPNFMEKPVTAWNEKEKMLPAALVLKVSKENAQALSWAFFFYKENLNFMWERKKL